MTVTLTTPVLGQAVGSQYTGPLESWLLNEGYARNHASSLTAAITVTETAAVLTGGTNAAGTVGTSGDIVFGTKGGARTTVSLLAADTAAGAATKIDTALAGLADAAIVSSKLQVTSIATGPTAYVTVVDGLAAVLTALGVTKGQTAFGGDGRPTGASNTGPQTDTPANDPQKADNREAPYFPLTDDTNTTIANDSANLTQPKFPHAKFDFDASGTDTEAPSDLGTPRPNRLPLAGGKVTLHGRNLEGVTGVTVGGTAATNLDVTRAGDGVISFTAPAKAAGSYDVVVTDPNGSATKTGGLTYAA